MELSSAPTMRSLYPRAVAGSGRALLRKLPGVGGGAKELPGTELVLADVGFDRDHLAAYDRVCGFRLSDELPPTYPHMPAFPLHMKLMTASEFPFPVIGLVHVRNRIVQRRPLRVDERPTLRVHAERLEPHPRGRQFTIVAEARVEGEPVWRGESVYLSRGGGEGTKGDAPRDASEPPRAAAVWELPGDLGRRYAAVSGDRNPIHMHPLSARLFGMKRPIAHGMWLKARCLAALEGTLPGALDVDVRFKRPVPLPGKVAFSSWPDGDARGFALHDTRKGKPHLEGRAAPA
jgi:hypothetical protein